jgi:acetyl-CoA synthetase
MTKQLSLEQIVACGVEEKTAAAMLPQLNQWLLSLPASQCWQQIVQSFLTNDFPFALHELLYETAFFDWDASLGPPPAWFPSNEQLGKTNIAALMNDLNIQSYPELHAWSVQHRAEFWDIAIQRVGIHFQQKYSQIVDLSPGVESPQWLLDARLNIAESCFNAPEDSTAIIFQPEGGSLSTMSYGELNTLSNRVANGLVEEGFEVGDAIAIAMPMTAESVAIYLGIIKAGCAVVSIADSFAASEIATRLRISNAKGIFTQDTILRAGKQLPLYSKIIEANAPKAIVLSLNSPLRTGDRNWEDFLSSRDRFEAVPTSPSAYTNILFSSGTTGEPKAIPWTQTTPIKCAVDGYLHHDIHPGDVVAWPTNLGWMMGPWLIYASLINRGAIALYYGTPTERGFGQFIQDARVNVLGLVPSLVSAWKTTACMKGLDWNAIKVFSSSGECSNPQDMLFLMSLAQYKPIIEYCGGTEIGGAYITGTVVQPCIPATFSTPALGLDIVIIDENGDRADKGEALIVSPSIGLSNELLNKDHHQVYFADTPFFEEFRSTSVETRYIASLQEFSSQYSSLSPLSSLSLPTLLRRHGDQMERLPNGYYRALGRVDDTMNLGGIKVSAAEIEQTLNTVEGICETAVIAISPPQGGPSQLVVYAVVMPEFGHRQEELKAYLQAAIRQNLNPLFKIRDLVIIEALPRTASNKVMRRVLRDRASI